MSREKPIRVTDIHSATFKLLQIIFPGVGMKKEKRRVQELKSFGREQKDNRAGSIQSEVLFASTVL